MRRTSPPSDLEALRGSRQPTDLPKIYQRSSHATADLLLACIVATHPPYLVPHISQTRDCQGVFTLFGR